MHKRIIILILFMFIFTGCFDSKINQSDDRNRFYLSNIFYTSSDFTKIDSNEFLNYQNGSYILYVYNNYCTLAVPCEDIFTSFMKKYQISFLSMPYKEFLNTSLNETVRYAPTIIIVENGEIKDFLDANSDDDLDKYQDTTKFAEWLNNYIYFSWSE